MDKVEVVAPVAEQLVRIEGDVARRKFVSNVVLRGLTFCHTAWSLPQKGYMCTQAEIIPPAAVHADGAIHCRIERCEFTRLGAWGIELRRGCKENVITRNTMRDIGAGCVKIGAPEDCSQDVEETSRTVIRNNYIHEGGEPVTFLSGKKYTFDQWKAKGMDAHSVIADPLFVDPASGNFSLKPDSPALKLGFKPIDISTVGPRP